MPKRKFNAAWLREPWAKGWLEEAEASNNSLNEAFCKVCSSYLRAHVSDLKKHGSTKHHEQRLARFNPQENRQQILNPYVITIKNEDKEKEIKLSYYICMHSAVRCVDHLTDMLKSVSENSKDIRLHRRKFSCIIKNVISSTWLESLLNDVRSVPFSIIVDESTDISTTKYMCVCIKYYSKEQAAVITHFLGLIELESCEAIALKEKLVSFLEELKLDKQYLIGVGTDGVNSLCGKNHSLYTLLRSEIKHIQLVRCICHSLNNAASKSSDELPANVEFMCKEIFKWFNDSSQRQIIYRRLFDMLNSNKPFHKFVQISTTRWLSRYNAVATVLEHWEDLKVHFSIVVDKEKCYTARRLNEMFEDNCNLLYFQALKPILYEINKINILFQKNNIDMGSAYKDLVSVILFLARKIMCGIFVDHGLDTIIKNIDNKLAYLKPEDGDYGIIFHQTLSKLQISSQAKYNEFYKIFTYIQVLLGELVNRLPNNLNLFQNISLFSPNNCLTQIRRKFIELPFLDIFLKKEHLEVAEIQYNKLIDLKWNEILDKKTLDNAYLFWPKVLQFLDAGGRPAFKELSEFVLTVLSLPSSNAVVERAFSVMNAIKIKSRNKLKTPLLTSILRIRFMSYSKGICCPQFTPTKDMFSKFNSEMYKRDCENDTATEEETFLIIDEVCNL